MIAPVDESKREVRCYLLAFFEGGGPAAGKNGRIPSSMRKRYRAHVGSPRFPAREAEFGREAG